MKRAGLIATPTAADFSSSTTFSSLEKCWKLLEWFGADSIWAATTGLLTLSSGLNKKSPGEHYAKMSSRKKVGSRGTNPQKRNLPKAPLMINAAGDSQAVGIDSDNKAPRQWSALQGQRSRLAELRLDLKLKTGTQGSQAKKLKGTRCQAKNCER